MTTLAEHAARHALAAAMLCGALAPPAVAQWRPAGELARVPVVRDCDEVAGDVAATRLDPPTVYVCPRTMALVRRSDPDAEHFYLVHEFGHVALNTADEAAADCWAAQQLAQAANGRRFLVAALAHFRSRPADESRRYGTPAARAARIARCAEEARPGLGLEVDATAPLRPSSRRSPR